MNDLSRHVAGRNKGRFAEVSERRPATRLTDRDVLALIAERADVLDVERTAAGLWLLVPLPSVALEYLATIGASTEDAEPDQDEGGIEHGGTEDDEPNADDEPDHDAEVDACTDRPDFTGYRLTSTHGTREIRRVRDWCKARTKRAVRKRSTAAPSKSGDTAP